MATQNLSNFDAVLKEFYAPAVQDTLNNEVMLMKYIEQDASSANWAGNKVIIPQRMTRNVGVGARADGQNLPVAGRQGYAEQQVSAKYNYARMAVTLPTIVASRDNSGAFIRAVDSEMRGLMKDFKNDINRQLFGAHILGSVNAAVVANTSVVVKDGYDANVGTSSKALRHLRVGQVVDFYTGTSLTDSATISAINTSTNTLTMSANVTLSEDDDIYVSGTTGGADEIEGLLDAIATSGTYQNISRSTYSSWQSNVLGNSGTARAITDNLLQQGVDAMNEQGNGELGLVIAHHSVRREYLKTLSPDKRFASTELKGGHSALMFNGVDFQFDKDCPFRKVFLLDPSTWRLYKQSDIAFADQDGAILSRVTNGAEFEAFLYWYANLACESPNANARIDDISASE